MQIAFYVTKREIKLFIVIKKKFSTFGSDCKYFIEANCFIGYIQGANVIQM